MIQNITLREYQVEAVAFLRARGRALLSLVMGAGKTVVSIAAVEELIDDDIIDRGIVIVPASLKYQWQAEIKRFTGRSALVIDGDKTKRHKLYNYSSSFVYTIVNYETLLTDWQYWRMAEYDFVIVDEVTYCKSFTAKRSKKVKFLTKRCDVVFGLTGQPVENRAEELYSVMQVVDPEVLGDFRIFDRAFIVRDHWGKPVRYINLKLLRKQMADVMYRKRREDIADQFPRLVSSVIPFDLSFKERRIYQQAVSYTLGRLSEAVSKYGESFSLDRHYGHGNDEFLMKVRGDIMAGLFLLRLCCDDLNLIVDSAKLFEISEAKRIKENRKKRNSSDEGSQLAHDFKVAGLLDDVPVVSTKRALFKETLQAILEEDEANKVVAFSTFKGMIARVQDDTSDLTKSVQFTGDMNAWQKSRALTEFREDPDCRLFLSSDAGGYGVDLPVANYLCSLDLPWSTGAFEQRESRIIRISSEWEHVNLISLQAQGSIEQRMYNMIASKRGVSEAFIDGRFDSSGAYTPTLGTLTAFLEAHR